MHAVCLIEAQYQRDKEFRDRAIKFYEALRKWLDVPEDKLLKKLMPWGNDGFMVNARDFFEDEGFKGLSIVFTPSGDGSVRASLSMTHTGFPVMRIACLLGPRDPKYLADRITKSTVVHEAVHFLDRLREKKKSIGSTAAAQKGGSKAYYNHPLEWNAYWQAGAESAESMAKKTPPKAFDYYFGNGTLKSFVATAPERFWNPGFLDNMTPETRRRFDKRLSDLWVSFIEPIAKERLRPKRESLREDEQQRLVRASAVDDDHRLPNVHRIIPTERMQKIPYSGQSRVTIYRAVDKGDPNRLIRSGDWVTLSKRYAKLHMRPGGRILEREVSAYDVSWAGTDENEWFYTPLRKQVAR